MISVPILYKTLIAHDRRARILRVLVLLIVLGAVVEWTLSRAVGEKGDDLAALMNVAVSEPATDSAFTLCVSGPEFMGALARDLADAEESVYVQTLAFEDDPAGRARPQEDRHHRRPHRLRGWHQFQRPQFPLA